MGELFCALKAKNDQLFCVWDRLYQRQADEWECRLTRTSLWFVLTACPTNWQGSFYSLKKRL